MKRRAFLGSAAALAVLASGFRAARIPVCGHLWVYASGFPPDWDCTPIIEQVFSDFSYAGMDGLEVMHTNLRHPDAANRLGELSAKYQVPVIGSSYGAAMWDKEKSSAIIDECGMLFNKLQSLKSQHFGISVGDAGHPKSEEELDTQAEVLKKVQAMGKKSGITCNLHNHTYEVTNNMHDLRGTLKRIPGFPLGPDLNWLIRGGVDPVKFIREFKDQIVYLHLRDQDAAGKWSEALGEGDTNFVAISKALNEIKFKGVGTIELAFERASKPSREVRESWKMSRAFVKKTFGW